MLLQADQGKTGMSNMYGIWGKARVWNVAVANVSVGKEIAAELIVQTSFQPHWNCY